MQGHPTRARTVTRPNVLCLDSYMVLGSQGSRCGRYRSALTSARRSEGSLPCGIVLRGRGLVGRANPEADDCVRSSAGSGLVPSGEKTALAVRFRRREGLNVEHRASRPRLVPSSVYHRLLTQAVSATLHRCVLFSATRRPRRGCGCRPAALALTTWERRGVPRCATGGHGGAAGPGACRSSSSAHLHRKLQALPTCDVCETSMNAFDTFRPRNRRSPLGGDVS
ncbi:hypothetical protein BD310DRAFT_383644 [Dichomitus squalens]|uniref:Uncharacterized protein n=1 Tax=Dichomitus squalens TaxID=114155 RepID=A0A4Q9PY87_9APHY|nr:hypothetical protein BD310DRAFT_383644 [Dichomitus squalens]